MHDHDPDDAEMRAWLADGRALHGLCPYCGSMISVTQRDGWFRARCSHRGCGASGPRMRQIGRAVEMLARPPAYVARHMGVHPSSLTDVVSVLEGDRDAAMARAEAAEAERDEARAALTEANEITSNLLDRLVERSAERDAAEAEVARLRGAREAALREAAGVLRDAAKKHRHDADASRSVAASGGHVLAADILESYANMIDLLDAAPAAEGGE